MSRPIDDMQKKLIALRCVSLILALILFTMMVSYTNHLEQTLPVLSKTGSQGNEVRQIQQKLKELGFYEGSVDGIFGAQTKKSLMKFQQSKGFTADGVAGPQTLKALGIGSSSNSGNFSDNDVLLLANIISAESRGEPYEGQVAVGAVVLNRVEHPSFPDTLAGVVYQPGAFTAITDGQIKEAVAESAKKAARDALNGTDPSGGAIYYFNPDKTSNAWIRTRPVIKRIGSHLFCE